MTVEKVTDHDMYSCGVSQCVNPLYYLAYIKFVADLHLQTLERRSGPLRVSETTDPQSLNIKGCKRRESCISARAGSRIQTVNLNEHIIT